MAKAYFISCYRQVSDPAKLAAYAQLAVPAIEAGGGRFLARGVAAKAYEAGQLNQFSIRTLRRVMEQRRLLPPPSTQPRSKFRHRRRSRHLPRPPVIPTAR